MKDFELTEYMSAGIRNLVSDAIRSAGRNPRQTAFLLRFALSCRRAGRRRARREKTGAHIPAFLIASIAADCNLFCTGCYARANRLCDKTAGCGARTEGEILPPGKDARETLSDDRWAELFSQAGDLGVSFILLAGGEPFLHPKILQKAAEKKGILFPVFTNGTLLDDDRIRLLDRARNLLPVISLEGGREKTDYRRGKGTYEIVDRAMGRLKCRGILFGTSITVTAENIGEVCSDEFIAALYETGCRIVFYIEYVPVADGTGYLTLGADLRTELENRQNLLRERFRKMMFISFPGDEKYTGGCLAAGRGFFHINPYGAAEPCPFSPYSDTDLKTGSLLQALQSPLFQKLKESGFLDEAREGGCSLFAHDGEIRELIR